MSLLPTHKYAMLFYAKKGAQQHSTKTITMAVNFMGKRGACKQYTNVKIVIYRFNRDAVNTNSHAYVCRMCIR